MPSRPRLASHFNAVTPSLGQVFVLLLNSEALFCVSAGIPCEPPPDIPNGKHTGRLLDEFFYGISVTYTCNHGYPLQGESSIHCTTRDGQNGVWSGPPPRCGGRGWERTCRYSGAIASSQLLHIGKDWKTSRQLLLLPKCLSGRVCTGRFVTEPG